MSKFLVYIHLEPYIKQWFIHENGGTEPVELVRGATERSVLEVFLQKTPPNFTPTLPDDSTVAIVIPEFKLKSPSVYNHLPTHAVRTLVDIIRQRFDVQLFRDLHRFGNLRDQTQNLIYAWMECHGIEINETNWNSIAKRYQRRCRSYSRHHKKEPKQT